MGAPLCELGDDGAEGEAEEIGAACTYKGGESQQCNLRQTDQQHTVANSTGMASHCSLMN